MAGKSIFHGGRQPWQVLNAAHIQLIALLTMLFQHATLQLLGSDPWEVQVTRIGAIVSRVAFPLFCLMLVEGVVHTRSRWKYGLRLFCFAWISVVPYAVFTFSREIAEAGLSAGLFANLGRDLFGNVLFELFAGYLMIWGLSRSDKWLILAPVMCWLAEHCGLMYGWYGVAMILCLYGCREDRVMQAVSVAVLSIFYGYADLLNYGFNPYGPGVYTLQAFAATVRSFGPRVPTQCWAAVTAIPILLYGGEKGQRLPKYVGYAFYPAHLLILGIYGVLFPAV